MRFTQHILLCNKGHGLYIVSLFLPSLNSSSLGFFLNLVYGPWLWLVLPEDSCDPRVLWSMIMACFTRGQFWPSSIMIHDYGLFYSRTLLTLEYYDPWLWLVLPEVSFDPRVLWSMILACFTRGQLGSSSNTRGSKLSPGFLKTSHNHAQHILQSLRLIVP